MIEPGEEFLVISGGGANLADATRASEAYGAGFRQAEVELERIAAVWNGSGPLATPTASVLRRRW